jgi:hypothetical protein
MISTHRRRAFGFTWLAALTMTVLAASPLLAIFHQISSRHAVCEHGELVESGHSGISTDRWAGVSGEWARGASDGVPEPMVRPASDAVTHGHSHCSLGTLARSNVGLVACAEVVTAALESVIDGEHRGEIAFIRTVLLTAPKTSPPRVAS